MLSDFAKEKVFWTRKMNLKLVKYIENRPHMWNQRHPKYTSTKMKDHTYAQFAAEYGNEFTGRAVKDRWTNIRTTFGHLLRKVEKEKCDYEDNKVKWHLWEACQFLRNAGKQKNEGSIAMDTTLHNSDFKDENQSDVEDCEEPEDGYNSTLPSTLNCDSLAENLLKVFRGVQNDVFGVNHSKHAKLGRTITKKLTALPSYDAARMSHEIMNILLLYDDNNPDNPNTINK